jgi:predicted transcriptional regulator
MGFAGLFYFGVSKMEKKLKRDRVFVGFRQDTLAAASGVSLARIAFCESGRLKYRASEISAIRAAIQKRARLIAEKFAVAA